MFLVFEGVETYVEDWCLPSAGECVIVNRQQENSPFNSSRDCFYSLR